MGRIKHYEPDKELLKIADVPNFILMKTGVRRSVWIVYHWIKKGRRNYSNYLVKLKTMKICGQVFTRQPWVMNFLRRLEE